MPSSTTFTDSTTDHDAARRALLPVGVATFAGSAVWTVLGAPNLRDRRRAGRGSRGHRGGLRAPAAPVAAASAGGTALTLALLAALLTLPAFWSGLPLILGSGRAPRLAGRNAATGAGKSAAAIGIGALAVLGYLTIYIVDGLLMGNV